MTILIVGEQANIDYPFRRHMDPERWYKMPCCDELHEGRVSIPGVGLRIGAFRGDSKGLRRLAELCAILGDENPQNVRSINLCYPGKIFDTGFADQVAAMIRDDEESWGRVVLCGRRVARCFGIDWVPYWGSLVSGRYVPMPHLSGRNRWWNREYDDLERLMTIQLACRSLVDERYVVGVCKVCTQPIIAMDLCSGLCPIHEGDSDVEGV